MNKYESFRIEILKKAASSAHYGGEFYANTYGLGSELGIPEPHVREQFLKLAEIGLIALTVFDAQLERQYNEWPKKDSFFFDSGSIRIRLLSAGGELLAGLPKITMGFVQTSK